MLALKMANGSTLPTETVWSAILAAVILAWTTSFPTICDNKTLSKFVGVRMSPVDVSIFHQDASLLVTVPWSEISEHGQMSTADGAFLR